MGLKSNRIKNMSDFVAGLILLSVGMWLMFSEHITEGRLPSAVGQGLIRADTYIKMLGGIMSLLAFIMVVRSINFKKIKETQAFEFRMAKESFLTFAGLLLYIILLKPLGFAAVTFLFTFSVGCIYMFTEIKDKGLSRNEKIKKIAVLGIFSLVMVFVVYWVFGIVLKVQLP